MKSIISYFVLIFLISGNVSAWNERGHQVIASLAYDELGSTRRAMFTELLKRHPYIDEWMEEFDGTDEELGRYLFCQAAIWPDQIKGSDYNFPFVNESWHYVKFRVDFVNGHNTTRSSSESDILYALGWAKRIMVQKWSANSGNEGFRYTDESKAIAFSWILHLIGDLHQPLHCANLYNALLKNGDSGGNAIYIRKKNSAKTAYSLHSYWDQLLGDNGVSLKTVSKQSQQLKQDYKEVTFPSLEDRNVYNWSYESHRLAISRVYANGLIGKDESFLTKDTAPALPQGYSENAIEIAKKRAYLAAVRTAVFIRTLKWFE